MPEAPPPIRPMRVDDALAVHELCSRVLFAPQPGVEEELGRARSLGRIEHLVATDPGGVWVAEAEGRIVGVAMALMRERIWGFSLYAVDEALQGRGVGRRLLDASLAYGEDHGAQGWIILSSEHPGAMRRYARAGFALDPCVAAMGIPDLTRAPDAVARVEDAGAAGIPLADAIGRAVRGAGHGPDIPTALAGGARLLVLEDRAFALMREGNVMLLAATDDEAAGTLLWAGLTRAPRGATALIDFMTGAQQWAITVCLDAGLPLSPDGPAFTKGRLGPLAPYLPSGAYL
ncbi:MAG TPA: GNAT family N-acetyltransferase [Solirubrobacteraceae bacterium]